MKKSLSLLLAASISFSGPSAALAQTVTHAVTVAPGAPVALPVSVSGALTPSTLPTVTLSGGLSTVGLPTVSAIVRPGVVAPLAAQARPAVAAKAAAKAARATPAAAVAARLEPAQAAFQSLPAGGVDALGAEAGSGFSVALEDALTGRSGARYSDAVAGVSFPLSANRFAEDAPQAPEPAPTTPAPAPHAAARSSKLTNLALRMVLAPFVRTVYRYRVRGFENLPRVGGALIVPNHVSYIDGLLMAYAARRPVRFLMYRKIYETPGLQWLFKAFGAIPIASGDGKKALEDAFKAARGALDAGDLVVIFPEGQLTRTGNFSMFRRGFVNIVEGSKHPVIPVHIDGLWGSVFSRRQGESFWERFKRIPRPMSIRFGTPLSDVSPQAAMEAVQQLSTDSFAERLDQSGQSLAWEAADSAKRNWKKQAVVDSTGKKLTFGETLTGSVVLARKLSAVLGDAAHVGVLLPPSAGGVLSNLALASLGKIPVNLNYTASAEAMAHAGKLTGMTTVVTSRLFVKKLEEKLGTITLPASAVYLEDILPQVSKREKTLVYLALRLLPKFLVKRLYFRRASRSLDDTATVLFTSGSSALPKGVELTHANIRSNIEMVQEIFQFGPGDSVLGVLPFFHSFGLTVTLWLPLIAGFTGVYHTHPLEHKAINKLALEHKPTILLGTPTFLGSYVKGISKEAFSRLRMVMGGAEKLRTETADAFEKQFGIRPLEGYGATELSPIASANIPDGPDHKGTKAGSVGQPLPGVAAKVVDPDTFEPLAVGKAGMLLVRGPNVMKGYLNDEAKTKQALRDGWYVTGDMAVIDKEGFITLAGRLSRFSKIAGEMVSHVAVEDALQKAAGLSEQKFVVAGVPDASRGERLVVLHAGYEGDIDALLTAAQAAGLPKLWTPGRNSFYKIDAIPVLGTGKLDLQAVNKLAKELAAKE